MAEIVRSPETDELFARLDDSAGRADPYPVYEEIRARGRMVQHPDGRIMITGYDDCRELARDPRRFGHADPDQFFAEMSLPQWRDFPSLLLLDTSMATANPPVHTRLRTIVNTAFTARRVEQLRHLVETRVGTLLDDLADGGCLVDLFAFPLSVSVIGELLGVPASDHPMFKRLMTEWLLILDQFDEQNFVRSNAAATTVQEYFSDLVATRRADPGEDMISALVRPSDGSEGLDDEEAVAMAALLFSGGFSTTTHLISNGTAALLANPEQAEALRTDPGLAGSAVEEVLRHDPPVHIAGRTARADTDLLGVPVAAGQKVTFLLGAANRDPAVFTHPDRFDVRRDEAAQLAFGGGIHHCLGASLARLEAQVALPAVVSRFPGMARAGEGTRVDSLMFHGYESLPVTC